MSKRLIFLSAFLAISFLSTIARADNDFRLWLESGVKYKVTKKLRLEASQILRLDENSAHLENTATEIGVGYKLFDFLTLKGGYRVIVEPNQRKGRTDIDLWHRFFGDAKFDYGWNRFEFEYRFRYQESFAWLNSKKGFTAQHTLRNKVGINYKAGKGFYPFVSGELFGRLGDKDGFLQKWRASGGVEYHFRRHHEASLYYLTEKKLNSSDDTLAHVLGLSYFYSF